MKKKADRNGQRLFQLFIGGAGSLALLMSCSSSADTSYLQEAEQTGGGIDRTDGGDGGEIASDPSGDFEAEVREGTFQIELVLPGEVARGQFTPLASGSTWSFESDLAAGDTVAAGEEVGDRVIESSLSASLEESAKKSESDRIRLDDLSDLEGPVLAPISGTIDPVTGVVYGPGLELVTPMNPTQELRFLDLELTGAATVETIMGIRTYQCDALWIDSNDRFSTESVVVPQLSVPDGEEDTVDGADSPSVVDVSGSNSLDSGSGQRFLHCRLPSHAETVPGITGTVTVTAEPLEDVTLVPVYYLQYEEESEKYFVTTVEDGDEVDHEVILGPTDGVVRVVISELPIGATLVAK